MNKIITVSLIATLALSNLQAISDADLAERVTSLEKQLKKFKKKLRKQKKKINMVRAHDAGDNIKWNVDFRTSIDNINYDMADGTSRGKADLMSNRLWLNMAYSPDNTNIFKAQLSYNKAYGADFQQTPNPSLNQFGVRGTGLDTFDWVTQEALTDGSLKVRQAYWLYLGEDMGESIDIPWTMSIGRRPSTNGFLASLRDDDPAQSPLGHIINVEFDGISSKFDFSNLTGIQGLSLKFCGGQGSTNAIPRMGSLAGTDYANDNSALDDTQLGGFIIEPYNDGQYIWKTTLFKAFNMPGFDSAGFINAFEGNRAGFRTVGNMIGGASSLLIDGLTDDGYLADVKLFGSFAFSQTDPDAGKQMLGFTHPQYGHIAGAKVGESKTGYSVYVGAQLPVTEDGKFGLEYNYGTKYWRPYTYAEDTFAGSKLAARGNAIESYFTYQLSSSLSAQLRYTYIDYDFAGSNGFFASAGAPFDISKVTKDAEQALAGWKQLGGTSNIAASAETVGNNVFGQMFQAQGLAFDPRSKNLTDEQKGQLGEIGKKVEQQVKGMAFPIAMAQNIVDKAQDIRFYIRYRF